MRHNAAAQSTNDDNDANGCICNSAIVVVFFFVLIIPVTAKLIFAGLNQLVASRRLILHQHVDI